MSRRRAIRARVALAALLLAGAAIACSEPPPEERPIEPGAVPVADPAGRSVVAEVNGMPVYEDCVATQAAAHGLDRRAALEECITFELLAQEAAARGLGATAEVRWARKAEAVRRLIDVELTGRYPDPDSMEPALLEDAYRKLRARYLQPERRHAAHALARAKNEPVGSPKDQAAEALAREIYDALKSARALEDADFFRRVEDIAGEREILHEGPFAFHRRSRLAESFIEATFALPEAGMVSAPVRSHEGWHVILLTRIEPELNVSVEEAKAELFEYQRRQLYAGWVSSLMRGAQIQIDEGVLAWLQAVEDEERFGEPFSP